MIFGIYSPIPTPFTSDEKIAYDKLEFNLSRWKRLPLDGVVIPGSNSEVAFLKSEEKLNIWKVCAGSLFESGKKLIAGTGAETTSETIELTCKAASLGAVLALVTPPFYYKPSMNRKVLVNHFTQLATLSPIPIILYNVPAFTGLDFDIDTLKALAEIPNIIGIKDSSSNIIKMSLLLTSYPDFKVFCGTGSALLPYLSVGAMGGVMALANIAAVPLRMIYDAFFQKRFEDALIIQRDLVSINTALTSRFGISGLKYAMDRCGYFGGPTRLPLLPLDDWEKKEVDKLVYELCVKYQICQV